MHTLQGSNCQATSANVPVVPTLDPFEDALRCLIPGCIVIKNTCSYFNMPNQLSTTR